MSSRGAGSIEQIGEYFRELINLQQILVSAHLKGWRPRKLDA